MRRYHAATTYRGRYFDIITRGPACVKINDGIINNIAVLLLISQEKRTLSRGTTP